jgi:5-methylcytosine-specific restriction endonuclease McrA
MQRNALVLNKHFYAVHIADCHKTMAMLYTGEAVAVDSDLQCYDFKDWAELSALMDSHPNGFINTVTMKIAVPEIVKLVKFDRLPKRAVKFSRSNVYMHYGRKCCYCGIKVSTQEATWDHVIPRAKGGSTDWKNIVLSCRQCNARKADKTPEEAGMTLRVQPSRPQWKGAKTVTVAAPLPIPVSWQAIVDKNYWDSELEKN